MSETKIVGYKSIFGFVLPDWVDETLLRTLIMFLLLSVVMFFVLIFVIWPKFSVIDELKSILFTKQTQLEVLKSSKEGFDKINDQVPVPTQELILRAIPQSYSPENSIFILRNISNEIPGVSIVSYTLPGGVLFEADKNTVGKSASNNDNMVNFIAYPIKLTVSAPINSMIAFIDKIENSIPIGVVSDVNMQEISKLVKSNNTAKTVNMNLEIRYYQAALQKVDITNMKPFTDEDFALIDIISGYKQIGSTGTGIDVPVAVNTSNSLFGF